MEPDRTLLDTNPYTAFPIVGIGASAGGLHSFECFLEALPKDFNFAVVFIQHLSPAHKNLMPESLRSKWRDHEFIEIEDGLQLLPGRLYLCPSATEVRIHEGAFRVNARPDEHIHFPIDEFFVSLAEDAAERTVAVIFSGAGSDGIRGIQAVRSEGGTVYCRSRRISLFLRYLLQLIFILKKLSHPATKSSVPSSTPTGKKDSRKEIKEACYNFTTLFLE